MITGLLIGIFLIILGILLLLYPYKIQTFAMQKISVYSTNKFLRFISFPIWVKSNSYIIFLRILGIILTVVGASFVLRPKA